MKTQITFLVRFYEGRPAFVRKRSLSLLLAAVLTRRQRAVIIHFTSRANRSPSLSLLFASFVLGSASFQRAATFGRSLFSLQSSDVFFFILCGRLSHSFKPNRRSLSPNAVFANSKVTTLSLLVGWQGFSSQQVASFTVYICTHRDISGSFIDPLRAEMQLQVEILSDFQAK